jgi:hypothetical protein
MTMLVTDARPQGAALYRKIAAFVVEFVRWTKGVRRPLPATIRGRRDKSFDQGEGWDLRAWARSGGMLGLFPRLSSPPAADHWQGGNKYRKMLIYGA